MTSIQWHYKKIIKRICNFIGIYPIRFIDDNGIVLEVFAFNNFFAKTLTDFKDNCNKNDNKNDKM
jgi:hypothetical protein